MGLSKNEYLQALKDTGLVEDAAPEQVIEGEPPPPKKVESKPPEVEKDTAPLVDKSTSPQVESAAPTETKTDAAPEPELFPGFNLLDKERQEEVRARWEAAEKAAQLAEDLRKREMEFRKSQERLAPMQRQLSVAQAEIAKRDARLREIEAKRITAGDEEMRAKLEEFRADYPAHAELLEGLSGRARQEAEEALRENAELRQRIDRIEAERVTQRELSTLTEAHPDWKQARFSQEFKVWHDNLDSTAREIIDGRLTTSRAVDSIYVLNEFKRDLALARMGSEAPNSAAPVKVPVPEIDPVPSTRQTVPVTTRQAGQPMSDKKREFIEAAEFLEKQQKQRRRTVS